MAVVGYIYHTLCTYTYVCVIKQTLNRILQTSVVPRQYALYCVNLTEYKRSKYTGIEMHFVRDVTSCYALLVSSSKRLRLERAARTDSPLWFNFRSHWRYKYFPLLHVLVHSHITDKFSYFSDERRCYNLYI